METVIRDFSLKDIDRVYNLLNENFTFSWSKENLKLLSKNIIKKVLILNGEIIGFLELQTTCDEADLTMIVIKKNFQQLGFGKKLLKETMNNLKKLDINKIYLEVSHENQTALNFYKKLGFIDYGERKNYYKDGSNAILLKKEIT